MLSLGPLAERQCMRFVDHMHGDLVPNCQPEDFRLARANSSPARHLSGTPSGTVGHVRRENP
jgi:hypothetical protein